MQETKNNIGTGKLELKHIVSYLPYSLKILNGWRQIKTLRWTHLDCEGTDFINMVQPILRPLSDLTKEISHNGLTFVPMQEINKIHTLEFKDGLFNDYVSDGWTVNWLPLCIIEKLYEWHFDIHGLIEKGLAIDLNTLPNDKS